MAKDLSHSRSQAPHTPHPPFNSSGASSVPWACPWLCGKEQACPGNLPSRAAVTVTAPKGVGASRGCDRKQPVFRVHSSGQSRPGCLPASGPDPVCSSGGLSGTRPLRKAAAWVLFHSRPPVVRENSFSQALSYRGLSRLPAASSLIRGEHREWNPLGPLSLPSIVPEVTVASEE